MNDDTNKPKESGLPTHEAAKIVIPFDIDMSQVETKLSEIENRFSKFRDNGPSQSTINLNPVGSADSYGSIDSEKSQSEMQATLARMSDLLRQINDTVYLIYSNFANRQ